MLKKRVIATLLIRDGIVVQSTGFRRYLPVGKPEIAVEFFNQWGVDEIILLDISATRSERGPDAAMIKRITKHCRVPLTVGGGIRSLEHARDLVGSGADKLSLNQACLHSPELLQQIADVFGSQCVVGAIDGIKTASGHRVYDYLQGVPLPQAPENLARNLASCGCGEILINSVDCDGACQGFDLPLIRSVRRAVNVPVIGCGGAGRPSHFIKVFDSTGVHAAAAANFFHYSEHSITIIKAQLSKARVSVRHDTHAQYMGSPVNALGRLRKKPDSVLEEMLYVRMKKEVI